MLLTALPILLGLSLDAAAASPSLQAPHPADHHDFQPVTKSGVRSPCPGANLLANYGYINRSGKNITSHDWQLAFQQAFNLDYDETAGAALGAMSLCARLLNISDGLCTTQFSLDMLNVPHELEHDASQSRNDRYMYADPHADNVSFNQTVWDATLDIIGRETTHIDARIANTVRLRRVEQARKADFAFEENAQSSFTEHSFLLTIFNDPEVSTDWLEKPQARKDWIDWFFVNESFPTPIGWKKPKARITDLPTLQDIIKAAPTIPASAASAKRPEKTPAPSSASTSDPLLSDPPSSAPQEL